MVGQGPEKPTIKSAWVGKRRTRTRKEDGPTGEMAEVEEREDKNAKNGQNEEKDMLGKVPGREWTK